MYQDLIRNELNEAAETLANFLKDDANIHAIQRAAVLLADSFKAGGKVLSCGNGGFPCDAMALSAELTGGYPENRPGYPALASSYVF
ncbi:SIS domain-containing protein, partial [Klebsiella pneumoniae]|nr:SIS domain-containing protein [Klebsiella pneumoniae]